MEPEGPAETVLAGVPEPEAVVGAAPGGEQAAAEEFGGGEALPALPGKPAAAVMPPAAVTDLPDIHVANDFEVVDMSPREEAGEGPWGQGGAEEGNVDEEALSPIQQQQQKDHYNNLGMHEDEESGPAKAAAAAAAAVAGVENGEEAGAPAAAGPTSEAEDFLADSDDEEGNAASAAATAATTTTTMPALLPAMPGKPPRPQSPPGTRSPANVDVDNEYSAEDAKRVIEKGAVLERAGSIVNSKPALKNKSSFSAEDAVDAVLQTGRLSERVQKLKEEENSVAAHNKAKRMSKEFSAEDAEATIEEGLTERVQRLKQEAEAAKAKARQATSDNNPHDAKAVVRQGSVRESASAYISSLEEKPKLGPVQRSSGRLGEDWTKRAEAMEEHVVKYEPPPPKVEEPPPAEEQKKEEEEALDGEALEEGGWGEREEDGEEQEEGKGGDEEEGEEGEEAGEKGALGDAKGSMGDLQDVDLSPPQEEVTSADAKQESNTLAPQTSNCEAEGVSPAPASAAGGGGCCVIS